MDSLFSFPVGLFHPLQHAGLSRRTPVCPLSLKQSGNDEHSLRKYHHFQYGVADWSVAIR